MYSIRHPAGEKPTALAEGIGKKLIPNVMAERRPKRMRTGSFPERQPKVELWSQ